VNNKHELIAAFLRSINDNIDVCVLTETWLSSSMVFEPFDGFMSHHKPRLTDPHGGVTMLIRTELRSCEFDLPCTPTSFEYICRKISTTSEPIILSWYIQASAYFD
jgi:hypothetical protein